MGYDCFLKVGCLSACRRLSRVDGYGGQIRTESERLRVFRGPAVACGGWHQSAEKNWLVAETSCLLRGLVLRRHASRSRQSAILINARRFGELVGCLLVLAVSCGGRRGSVPGQTGGVVGWSVPLTASEV